jgi:hypothetical protein
MIELTEAQRESIHTAGQLPAKVIDPQTRATYVLLPTGVYKRLLGMLDDDLRLLEPLLASLDPEDWEDASA